MSPASFLSFLFFFFFSCSASSSLSSTLFSNDTKLSAYEVLQSYNFPVGLLPQGVVSYTLNRETGDFTADLGGTCEFSIQGSYQLRYKSTITGVISKGKLSNLNGVSVKVLLFWVNIIEVTCSGDQLEFSVGILSADFPVDNFVESPKCGCGMDCVTWAETDIERRFSTSNAFADA